MKFALVGGVRREALPELSGVCPLCSRAVVARCGAIRVWHWSHLGRRLCDSWWENETEWHRRWKALFPLDWQEVVHRADDGERHIADVRTAQGWVLEFQHSYLNAREREARDAFYPRLVWVVDGLRRKRDRSQFLQALKHARQIHPTMVVVRLSGHRSALVRDWVGGRAPVFIDFGQEDPDHLWCLAPCGTAVAGYAARVSKASFATMHLAEEGDKFSRLLERLNALVARDQASVDLLNVQTPSRPLRVQSPSRRFGRAQTFQHYLARQARKRERF